MLFCCWRHSVKGIPFGFLHPCHLLYLLPKYHFLMFLQLYKHLRLLFLIFMTSSTLFFLSTLPSRLSLEDLSSASNGHHVSLLAVLRSAPPACSRSSCSPIPLDLPSWGETEKPAVGQLSPCRPTGLRAATALRLTPHPLPMSNSAVLSVASTGLRGLPGWDPNPIPNKNVYLLAVIHFSGSHCCTCPSTVPVKDQETSKWII